MRIFIKLPIGKPGAGKGTRVSKFLKGREDQYEVLGTSALLKAEVKAQTELGKRAKACMDAGNLVPDEIVIGIVIGAIRNAKKTVILDGFPRTVNQAKALLDADIYPDSIIKFYVDDEVVVERAKDRIVCADCGEPYTLNNFNPPKEPGICDKCGGVLKKRKDDEETTVRHRLNVYQEETYPIIEFFKEKGFAVHTIDSNTPGVSETFEKLMLEK